MTDHLDDQEPVSDLMIPVPDTTEGTAASSSIWQGNNTDLMALVGVTISGMILFYCGTLGIGAYCIPIIPIILGIIGLVNSKDALNPERTKTMSWISIGVGAAFILLLVLVIAAYFAFIAYLVSIGEF